MHKVVAILSDASECVSSLSTKSKSDPLLNETLQVEVDKKLFYGMVLQILARSLRTPMLPMMNDNAVVSILSGVCMCSCEGSVLFTGCEEVYVCTVCCQCRIDVLSLWTGGDDSGTDRSWRRRHEVLAWIPRSAGLALGSSPCCCSCSASSRGRSGLMME